MRAKLGGVWNSLSSRLCYRIMLHLELHEIFAFRRVSNAWNLYLQPFPENRPYFRACARRGFSAQVRPHCWRILLGMTAAGDAELEEYQTIAHDGTPKTFLNSCIFCFFQTNTLYIYIWFDHSHPYPSRYMSPYLCLSVSSSQLLSSSCSTYCCSWCANGRPRR
jgi:hypothetical protein